MIQKTTITTAFFCLATVLLWGQERIPVDLKSTQLNINLFTPSVSFEKSISPNQSLNLSLGISCFAHSDQEFSLTPNLRGSFRNYYARKSVRKQLNPNSGNYVALDAGYYFDSITNETTRISNTFFVGPVWGIQRNYKSGIHLGFSIGPGVFIADNTEFQVSGIGQLQLGFVLN